ncbi:unnamed protein product, partial [Owenia fusiformis]
EKAVLTSSPVEVLVIGHSFVKRLEAYVYDHPWEWDPPGCNMTYVSESGGSIGSITEKAKDIQHERFHIAYIQCGGNEVVAQTEPENATLNEITQNVTNQMMALADEVLCKLVYIGKIPQRWLTPKNFKRQFVKTKDHAGRCNQVITQINEKLNDQKSTVILFSNTDGIEDDFQDVLSDGTHFNKKGHELWQASMQTELNQAIKKYFKMTCE